MATLKDLLVNGNSSLLGTTTAVSILPQTDATYDLGSSTLNWNNIYGTAIKVTAYENTIEIGSKNASYSHIYASLPFAFNLNLVPSTNKGKNLGTESMMWGTIYSSNYIVRPTADAMSETASGFRVEGVVSGNVAKYGNFSIGTAGTTSATGICSLSLGNSILTSLTNNAKGRIFLYGTNTKATLIETTFNGSSAHSIMYFPNHAGPGYLVHAASEEKVGDTNLPVYVAANGRVTATGYTFTTDKPTNASDDTTIPTSKAAYTMLKRLIAYTGLTQNTWYKIYASPLISSNGAYSLTIALTRSYANGYGILNFYIVKTTNSDISCSAAWLCRKGFSVDDIKYDVDTTNLQIIIYVYHKAAGTLGNRTNILLLNLYTRSGAWSSDGEWFLATEGTPSANAEIPTSNGATRAQVSTTENAIAIYSDTIGTFADSGKTITTNAPTSSSDNTTVPTSAAVWSAVDALTDTKNTAGSTDTSSKIYLIGATTLAANPLTYSDNEVFVTNGVLDAKEVSTSKLYIYGNKTTDKTNRFFYSDNLTTIYASVDGVASLVMTKTEVRRGLSANSINLGSSSYPWNNIYGNNFYGSGANLTSLNATNLASGTVAFARLPSLYAGKITITSTNTNDIYAGTTAITSAISYKTTPEVATIKINGDTSASAASTKNCTLQYDSTLQTLKFVFA